MHPAAKLLIEVLCAAVIATAAQAQDSGASGQNNPSRERPVKILPDTPDNVSSGPSISAADLASINLNMKTDNSAGLALDIIPGGQVIAGSKIRSVGFRKDIPVTEAADRTDLAGEWVVPAEGSRIAVDEPANLLILKHAPNGVIPASPSDVSARIKAGEWEVPKSNTRQ